MGAQLYLGDMNDAWEMAEQMKGYGFGITYDNNQWVSSFLNNGGWDCFYSSDAKYSIFLAYQVWKEIKND